MNNRKLNYHNADLFNIRPTAFFLPLVNDLFDRFVVELGFLELVTDDFLDFGVIESHDMLR